MMDLSKLLAQVAGAQDILRADLHGTILLRQAYDRPTTRIKASQADITPHYVGKGFEFRNSHIAC